MPDKQTAHLECTYATFTDLVHSLAIIQQRRKRDVRGELEDL